MQRTRIALRDGPRAYKLSLMPMPAPWRAADPHPGYSPCRAASVGGGQSAPRRPASRMPSSVPAVLGTKPGRCFTADDAPPDHPPRLLSERSAGYFLKHAAHIDSLDFIDPDYQLTSGVAESTCKRFGTDRMLWYGYALERDGSPLSGHPPHARPQWPLAFTLAGCLEVSPHFRLHPSFPVGCR